MEQNHQPQKIGLFGGTFNPPHTGHVLAAQSAAEQLDLDLLLFVPAGIPPHKQLPAGTPTARQRLDMLHLAVDGIQKVKVLDIELRRVGKSYTIDTVRALQATYPEAELFLMMGTDMFQSLETWKEFETLLSLVHPVVFYRGEPEEAERNASYAAHLKARYGADCTCLRAEPLVISSTDLRAAVGQGATWNKYVAPSVYGYILRQQLYGVQKDLKRLPLDDLRAVACSFLRAKRIPHVLGTERAAVALAERWGADKEEAQVAALFHDCTKRLDMEEQLKLCEKYGIVLDALERKTEKLLHAITGAEVARELLGVSDAVHAAIRWHTTGRAGMCLLEKVIYMADFIEETRDFPGVETLRALAFQDLDQAMLLGFQMTIEEMEEKGRPVHVRTLEARDWLKGNEYE